MGVSGANSSYGVQQAFSVAMMKSTMAMPAQVVGELMGDLVSSGDIAMSVGVDDILGTMFDEYA